MSAEWKSNGDKAGSGLFSKHWRRVVLDEAHIIRNDHAQVSRAICDLAATSRWAVTGTPIQNRLDDLASLLRFIRAFPYHDPRQFKADISQPWKAGDETKAVSRLKRLSASLVLRRPKATISLPARHDLELPIDFNGPERLLYDGIRSQAITRIDEALQLGPDASKGAAYVNVLQQIESLRLTCDLGVHYHSRHDKFAERPKNNWAQVAQDTFNFQREMESVHCLRCLMNVSTAESLLDIREDQKEGRKAGTFFRCLDFCCGECTEKLRRSRHPMGCSHSPSCPGEPVSVGASSIENLASLSSLAPQVGLEIPSKIKALVTDIQSFPKETKCVVFSTWRLSLDIVEAGLQQLSIGNVRFDGKVPQKERQGVIDRFRTDPDIRVILLTLTCGAVGLTLTVASRAYLLEPHWNPNLEEQALARIHRIGQTQEVTTIRLYTRNTIEEQIMETQAAKKQLAGVLLAPHDGSGPDDRLGTLHKLRALL